MADYRAQFAEAIKNQMTQKDPVQAQYEAELMKNDQGASIAPTLGLVDHLTGSNLAQQVPKQESMKDKLGQLLQLKQAQQGQSLNGLGKLASMQGAAEDKAAQRAFQQQMYGLQLLKAKSKAGANGGGRKLGSEDIKSINNIDSMLADIPKLKTALQQGQKISPEILGIQVGGDNDATAARKRIKEWFGRNQSGGAIGNQEAKDFYEIISSVTDSDEMKLKKLDSLYNDVLNRRNSFYYGPTASPNQNAGGQRGPATGFDPMTADEAELDAWIATNQGG